MGEMASVRLPAREALDPNDYFASLMRAAEARGLLSSDDVRKLRASMRDLLARQCERYAHGRSSSVRVEAAEALFKSMEFVLSVRLKQFPQPDAALFALRSTPLEELFLQGERRVRSLTQATELFYLSMRERRFATDNLTYNATLFAGIAGFFRLYDPGLFAHRLHITADYPVCFYPQGAQGIEFIRSYLENWRLENEFCRLLSPAAARRALETYALGLREPVREASVNLYIVLLAAALLAACPRAAPADAPALETALERFGQSCPMREETLAYARRTVRTLSAEVAAAAATLARCLRLRAPQ